MPGFKNLAQTGLVLMTLLSASAYAQEGIKFMDVQVDFQSAARAFAKKAPRSNLGGGPFPFAHSVREYMSPVRHQGGRGTCATFAAIGLIEFYTGDDFSEQCVVWKNGGNEGAWPENQLGFIRQSGLVDERDCPYDGNDQFANLPQDYHGKSIAYFNFQSINGTDSGDTLDIVRSRIDQGDPVDIAVIVPDNSFGRVGFVSTPAVLTCRNVPYGANVQCDGHAVVVTGYNDHDQTLEFKNSWGADWGMQGYGTMSYDYFLRFQYGNITYANGRKLWNNFSATRSEVVPMRRSVLSARRQ